MNCARLIIQLTACCQPVDGHAARVLSAYEHAPAIAQPDPCLKEDRMKHRKRTISGLLAVAAALLVLVAPASAAGMTQIAALGTPAQAGECTELPSFVTFTLTGDLVGCWYTPELVAVHDAPSGTYRESGAETFVGCLADGTTCGTFNTTYKFEAKYDADLTEIFGHCEHPLVSGTGDFAGITGEIFVKDDVQAGLYYWRGHIALQ
jgi:hypothetical protein